MLPTKAYVGLGSNLGDRAGHVLLGVRGIMNAGLRVARLSSIYETEPVGVEDEQPAFLNMVAELDINTATIRADAQAGEQTSTIELTPSPEQLLARLLRIEYALGRRRDVNQPRHAARTLDLDLLLYGDALIATEFLTLPHPRLHLRRFVLAPLAELAPDALHPTLRQTFAHLLDTTGDNSSVKLWPPDKRMKAEG